MRSRSLNYSTREWRFLPSVRQLWGVCLCRGRRIHRLGALRCLGPWRLRSARDDL